MNFEPNFDQPKDIPNSLDIKEEPISPEKIKEIFENLQVPENSWVSENLNEYSELLQNEMPPVSELSFEGFKIYLSDMKTSNKDRAKEGDREFCIAYTPVNDKYVPHTYFLSRSQGVWRSLNGVVLDRESLVKGHRKGYSEDSIFLPIALQQRLLADKDLSTLETTTGKAMYEGVEIVKISPFRLPVPKEYDENISDQPKRLADEDITDPEQLIISEEEMPNFENVISEWDSTLKYHGNIHTRVFNSNDKSLNYMFSQRADGKAWLSGVEIVSSEVTPLGIRKEWVRSKLLAMPPYEYEREELQSYYNKEDTINHGGDTYIDVYTKFLSKIPMIKEFNRKFGQVGPK